MAEVALPVLPENFFPSEVSSVFVHKDYDVLDSLKLHSSELNLASSFNSPERQKSFLLGRKAAILTLMKLGVTAPVLRGSANEPIWPLNVVGSIAHSGEFALCVASNSPSILGIGVDIECRTAIDLKIAKRICTESEIERLPSNDAERLEKLLQIFSAKEAYYKAVYPILKEYLGFRDVELTWQENEFRGEIVKKIFTTQHAGVGKVGRGSCLVSVCYKLAS